ncbi:O-antigen ligase [Myxosarcina sp. GI1]|uniref:O-antigen ligase family protein n=1 Tax=Myxosarcina sp. GI1 TaxID=1541065 RepID=UPI00056324E1|nr:O-antigen ligase family protein [Myxosarcina sp. GI1]
MNIDNSWKAGSRISLRVGIVAICIGLILGILAGFQPLVLCLAVAAVILVVCFFTYFEQTVLGLLILRSSLDIFSAQQVPAAFAIGLDGLTILYVVLMLLLGRRIITDKFFWFFAAWVAIQGFWPILTAIGGLELENAFLGDSIREWVRIFSWLMVYLIISQLKGRLHPEQIANTLFFALIIPLFAATLQLTLPPYLLPGFLQTISGSVFEAGSRINGTLGHPNTFTTFLILFIGLTYWKVSQTKRPLFWYLLLIVETFFLVSTKALVGLPMLVVLLMALTVTRLNFKSFVGVVVLFGLFVAIFTSTEFGQEKLATVFETPLLNPNITINDAILTSWYDGNSFNWRLAQWTFLLQEWKLAPFLGYGLGLTTYLGPIGAYAHNDYIRVLVEEGLIGLFFFLVFYVFQFIHLLKLFLSSTNSSKKRFCLVLISLFFSALTGMITENIWSHTTFFFYWWTLLSIARWDWGEFSRGNSLHASY